MADNKVEKFKTALKDAKVPVLVLDKKWYVLRQRAGTTPEINKLEEELKNLLKRQAKINNEINAIKKLKKDLMSDIVSNMDDGAEDRDAKASDKKLVDNKRLIEESNDKIDSYEDELLELPREIDRVNKELMLKTMELCYDCLSENTDDIEKIADWIKEIRIELKKKVIKKQEMEIANSDFYGFMHDIFGHEAMNLFDMKYEPKIRINETKN
ncbi:MAG: hypothetical protein Q4D29_06520 [Lachnospiraceae bacterium]|nr:hypothetical protein [Lachnospiraceae bacterium]